MRTKTDALRSMQKYVSQVLAPNAILASLKHGTTVWTTNGRVKGAIDLPLQSWLWLRHQDRHAPAPVGSADDPRTFYLQSELVADPAAAAAAAGIALTGETVADFDLPYQPQWEVRLWYDRDEIPEDRPHARVHFVGAAGTSGPANYYEVTQPMAIECYPIPGETVKESTLRATAVEDILLEAFRGAGFRLGRPQRIPLWDFDGVGADETSEARNQADYMRLMDFSSSQLPDLEDPRRVRVVADVRVSWRRDLDLTTLQSRVPQPVRGTRIVESVALDFDGT